MKNYKSINNFLIVFLTINVLINSAFFGKGSSVLAQNNISFNWTKGLGGTGDDFGRAITLDASNNVYVTGYFSNTVDFDPGIGTANLTSAGNFDIFLAKYDVNGNYIFAISIGGSLKDEGFGVAVDVSGNVFITGEFRGSNVDFDPGAGVVNLSSAGDRDAFLAKYDPNGNYVYAIALGGTGKDAGSDVAVDANGNAHITGYFNGNVDFDPGTGTATHSGIEDMFLAKYDDNGNFVYAISIGGSGDDDAYGVAVDVSGNAYITGNFQYNNVDFDPGTGTANLSEGIFIAKYDALGNYVYAKSFCASGDFSNDIAVDAAGNAYITGSFIGVKDFDPGVDTAYLPGMDDIFLAKYDANGNYVYAKCIGGLNHDEGSDIAVDALGNAYITGLFYGPLTSENDFDPGPGTVYLSSVGFSYDIFVAKYDPSGNYVYAKSMGSLYTDFSSGIAVDNSGNVYMTGLFTTNVDFDPGVGIANYTTAGADDFFISKFNEIITWEWTGAVSTAWENANNWNPASVPSLSEDAIIPDVSGASGNFPVISTDATAYSLTIYPNATLNINPNASLYLNYTVINNGEVTVSSGGSLLQSENSGLLGNGNYHIQRFVPGNLKLIGSPIDNVDANNLGITLTGSNGGQVIPLATDPCNPDSVDATSPWGNLLELREYTTPISNCIQSLWFVKSAGNLENGRGYSYRGNATMLNFTGKVNNGTITFNGLGRPPGTINTDNNGGTQTRGWHWVSNPYPSPIILSDSSLGAGLDNTVYVFNNGVWNVYPLYVNTATLAVGQGFQVRKATVGATVDLTFTNNMRTAGNPVFFSQNPNIQHYMNILLDNGTHNDKTFIYFEPNSTDGFDSHFDACRLHDDIIYPMIYTIADDQMLSNNALPLISPGQTKIIPLSIRTEIQGNHTLLFTEVSTLNEIVTLEDLNLNLMQPVTEGYIYNFTTVAGDSRDRFLLHFESVATDNTSQQTGLEVKLYPNPTNGELIIENAKWQNQSLVIQNMLGETIMKQTISQQTNKQKIDISELPNGIYIVQLIVKNEIQSLRLVKQ